MRTYLNDGPRPKVEDETQRKQDIWSQRELNYPDHSAPASAGPRQTRLIERVVASMGFASFERAFFALTVAIVLAGSAIVFGAAFDKSGPKGDATIEPTIIVAKREKPVEEDSTPPTDRGPEPQAASSGQSAPKAPMTPPAIAATPSLLSQTPMRESAREALARASSPVEPVRETPAPDQATVPAAALGYAAAPEDAQPREEGNADDKGHSTKCFVKVGGRVLTNGNCQVFHKGSTVTLRYAGSTVTISPARGHEWTLSVGGRSLGKVYKSGGACWGSRNHTWICEKA